MKFWVTSPVTGAHQPRLWWRLRGRVVMISDWVWAQDVKEEAEAVTFHVCFSSFPLPHLVSRALVVDDIWDFRLGAWLYWYYNSWNSVQSHTLSDQKNRNNFDRAKGVDCSGKVICSSSLLSTFLCSVKMLISMNCILSSGSLIRFSQWVVSWKLEEERSQTDIYYPVSSSLDCYQMDGYCPWTKSHSLSQANISPHLSLWLPAPTLSPTSLR